MKKILTLLLAVAVVMGVNAQSDPVSWSFSSKKISDKVYEIHMVATLKSGWHIYSQSQPKDAIALPTKFVFANNPIATLTGAVKEVGKMEKYVDKAIKATAHQYSRTVTFVQKITLKSAAKPTINGTVEYQTCDDKQCLPPKKVPIKVALS